MRPKIKGSFPMLDKNGKIPKKYLPKEIEAAASGIENTATGSIITTTDSAEAPLQGLKIYGKSEQEIQRLQLADYTKVYFTPYIFTSSTGDEIEFEIINNQDGTFTANIPEYDGYMENNCISLICELDVADLKVGSLWINVDFVSGDIPSRVWFDPAFMADEEWYAFTYDVTEEDIVRQIDIRANLQICWNEDNTTEETMSGKSFTFSVTVYQDGDGTYTPYVPIAQLPNPSYPCEITSLCEDSGSVEVSVRGSKQMFNPESVHSESGFTIVNEDGSLTTEFTKSGGDYVFLGILSPGDYSAAITTKWSSNDGVCVFILTSTTDTNVSQQFGIQKNTTTKFDFSIDTECELKLKLTSEAGALIINSKIMLYQEGDGTYEPYKGTSATFTMPTETGLKSIPGTDIRDVIDLERGVRIQRVGEWVYTGGTLPSIATCTYYGDNEKDYNIIYWNLKIDGVQPKKQFCDVVSTHFINRRSVYANPNVVMIVDTIPNYIYFSHRASDWGFAYGDGRNNEYRAKVTEWMQSTFSEDNPLIVLYPLATPIETPLTPEEIEAYKALHTYKPNTTIYNSEGADMSVDYVADTKAYIDNKIEKAVAELSAAIITE